MLRKNHANTIIIENALKHLHSINNKLKDDDEFISGLRELDNLLCNTDAKTLKQILSSKSNRQALYQANEMVTTKIAEALFSEAYRAFAVLDFNQKQTVDAIIDIQNTHSNYIKNSILSCQSFQQRNLTIQRWLAVAYKAHQQGDFFTAKNIFFKLPAIRSLLNYGVFLPEKIRCTKIYFLNHPSIYINYYFTSIAERLNQ